MATSVSCSDDPPNIGNKEIIDPIKTLYPMVNETDTPLPRSWSSKDKYNFIGLSQNNLRVHYKGFGKTHKDAASVKATYPIPAACGLYYYEVKIVSKGRDGYMGIGLSTQGVNMNRLPGWDKNSYGYHGDDGHSFCSSGTGQPYGPTFTTGDVIGCGVNLIDNVCFYTKNGHYLGIAFTELPQKVYPTVGLQTPGEVVDANFGQSPFVFDILDMMRELRDRIKRTINSFPFTDTHGQWQNILYKMVSTYLVHHGYCATAEAFARATSQDLEEELTSIRNRQKIQKMVLRGRLGDAIKTVKELYPGLLDKNPNLLFVLRVRQFIEMVNGTDSEAQISCPLLSSGHTSDVLQSKSRTCEPNYYSRSHSQTPPSPSWNNGTSQEQLNGSTVQHTSVIQSTKSVLNNINNSASVSASTEELNERNTQESNNASVSQTSTATNGTKLITPPPCTTDSPLTASNSVSTSSAASSNSHINDSDIEMDCEETLDSTHVDDCIQTTCFTNGFSKDDVEEMDGKHEDEDIQDMDVENNSSRKMCGGSSAAMERMLVLGRELQQMSQNLRKELGRNKKNKIILQNAFSLLAYNDPWNSPVGWQLNPVEREPICQALNSAILESHLLPCRPPLEVCIAHTKLLVDRMSHCGLGSCAFASLETILGSASQPHNIPLDLSRSSSYQEQSRSNKQ